MAAEWGAGAPRPRVARVVGTAGRPRSAALRLSILWSGETPAMGSALFFASNAVRTGPLDRSRFPHVLVEAARINVAAVYWCDADGRVPIGSPKSHTSAMTPRPLVDPDQGRPARIIGECRAAA